MLLRRFYFAFVVIILAVAAACCRAEFQVNTYTSNDQQYPAIAINAEGDFVVAWRSEGQDGGSRGIYGQRFNADGTAIGDEFQINTNSVAGCTYCGPSVAVNGSGNFIVTWPCYDSSSEGISARRYDANGVPLTGEFLVNTYTDSRQLHPDVAMNDSGEFVIVWGSGHDPGHHDYTTGRKYNADGVPYGPEFLITQVTHGSRPDVVIDDSGDFVVVWLRSGDVDDPPAGDHIRFRRYNADGTPKGDAVQIADYVASYNYPSIAMDSSGNFIITWIDKPGTYDIYAQRFDSTGNAISGQFVVNSSIAGDQYRSSVSSASDGEFVIVWHGPGEGDGSGIFGQRFKSDGTFIGDEFRINTYTIGAQWLPEVAMKNNGEFITVWQSNGQDGDNYGIFGEFGPKICCGDFSGDLLVNFRDFAFLAEEWLQEGNSVQTDLFDDNKIDGLDLGVLSEQWLKPCYECYQANFYGDGIIDFKDYSILAGNWQGQGPLAGDITGNGTVDMADLKALLFHWLSYCPDVVWKPNIYLYPEERIELDVYITFPHGGRVTTSIPNYNNGWQITVEPSGIIDGEYEFLFYESFQPDYGQYEAGWVVAQTQLEDFFTNNMALTGFNQKEIDDFIEYWTPRLTEYPYYALYPQYNRELEEMIKFEFSRQPANLIRLIYSIRGLNNGSLNLQEPVIEPFAREGFTVTEWGVILK